MLFHIQFTFAVCCFSIRFDFCYFFLVFVDKTRDSATSKAQRHIRLTKSMEKDAYIQHIDKTGMCPKRLIGFESRINFSRFFSLSIALALMLDNASSLFGKNVGFRISVDETLLVSSQSPSLTVFERSTAYSWDDIQATTWSLLVIISIKLCYITLCAALTTIPDQ